MAWNSLEDFICDPAAAQTVLGVYLKRTYSRITSASSALGVLNDYVLYKSTHSHTNKCMNENHRNTHMYTLNTTTVT